jgi:hypothetical protein
MLCKPAPRSQPRRGRVRDVAAAAIIAAVFVGRRALGVVVHHVSWWITLSTEPTSNTCSWVLDLVDPFGVQIGHTLMINRGLASTRHELHSVTAALEISGLEADCHHHHLRMAETMIGVMGLEGLTTSELVALNALLVPAHARFLRRERRADRKRRSKATR